MPADGADHAIDIQFSVPFTHRLRVTDDVSGKDFESLLSVLGHSDEAPAKVLLWADHDVRAASGRIDAIGRKLAACDQVDLVAPPITVEGGESVKNSASVIERLLAQINDHGLDRRSYIVAIGGGAMLDAAGYAAAIAHRGIRLIRLPTTTLAQADSGVGVKNAINHFGKKNWVGTFAVPWAVINDAALLETLPDRDFRSGFTEAVKVALLKDPAQFRWLCRHAANIRDRQRPAATQAINQSCQLHLRHITEGGDPFEMLEARPLDFGHWSAHRLEPLTEYRIRHGEAVGIGVAIDCFYSSLAFGLPESAAMEVCRCLARLGVPLWDPALEPAGRLLRGLEEFRQHLGGRLTVTMLRGIGDPIDVHEIDPARMARAMGWLREVAHTLAAPRPDASAARRFSPADRNASVSSI